MVHEFSYPKVVPIPMRLADAPVGVASSVEADASLPSFPANADDGAPRSAQDPRHWSRSYRGLTGSAW
jgi:hypothetical protein